jgi:hypothetical protein
LATAVPGIQVSYEPPLKPELTIDGRALPAAGAGAGAIVSKLKKLHYIKES